MQTTADIAYALETFDLTYGGTVTNALATYAERMREVAGQAREAALAPSRPRPEPRAGKLDLTPSPHRFATIAKAFEQAAARADAAQNAYETLTALLDDSTGSEDD